VGAPVASSAVKSARENRAPRLSPYETDAPGATRQGPEGVELGRPVSLEGPSGRAGRDLPPGRKPEPRELWLRLAAAAVLLPPAGWLVWRGGISFAVAVSVVAALSSFEFYRLALEGRRPDVWPAMAASTLLPLLPSIAGPAWLGVAMAVLLALSILSWSFGVVGGDIPEAGTRASVLVAGCLFCGTSLACLVQLREIGEGRHWVLGTLGGVWANDAGAYFGGRLFGRHRLAPVVSPGKTWEGWVAGSLAALLVVESAVVLGLLRLSTSQAAAIAGLASVLGPLGDLSKSLLKRARGVKSSGRLIPGHGGILDRVDSLLFTSPAVLLYATLCGF
jgi:phosphatidate cytidylyltransferase